MADDCLQVENLEFPVSQLPEEVQTALNKAIDDEYKAQAIFLHSKDALVISYLKEYSKLSISFSSVEDYHKFILDQISYAQDSYI